jgi:hypothetical protein
MIFCIQYGEQECQGRLLYLSKEHSFDISPKAKFGGQSLLVNEVQLELTDELAIGYLWGLCPSCGKRLGDLVDESPDLFRHLAHEHSCYQDKIGTILFEQ